MGGCSRCQYPAMMSETGYEVTSNDQGRFRIQFKNDIQNIVGLLMAPESIEPELSNGDWIVLAFAVWDMNDRTSIDIACRIASSATEFKVGVRPFEFGNEFKTWAGFTSSAGALDAYDQAGQVAVTTSSEDHPVWFAIRSGTVIGSLVGPHTQSEVATFAWSAFCR